MNPIKEPIRRIFPSFSLNYQNFNDILSFHQNLHRLEIEAWQLSTGQFQGQLIEAMSNQVQIDRHFYNRLFKLEGTVTKNWGFAIPVHPLCLLFEQKYQLEDNYILLSPPQSAFKINDKKLIS
jgi:AraC family ethanolamine operon transcriptional activator